MRNRIVGISSILIAVIMLAGLSSSSYAARKKKSSKAEQPVVQSVLLCPIDLDPVVTNPSKMNLSDEVTNALFQKIATFPNLYVNRFNAKNPSIQRAEKEERIKTSQLEAPFNDLDGDYRRSVLLAKEWGAELVISGAVADYTYDAETRTVTITATVDILSVVDGEVLSSSGASSTVQGLEGERESVTAMKAIRDITSTIISQVGKSLGATENETTESN